MVWIGAKKRDGGGCRGGNMETGGVTVKGGKRQGNMEAGNAGCYSVIPLNS